MGYHTQMGPNCLVDKGIGISNDPALCGKELNESYCGTENDVIISCGGGELMCEVVPYIDFAGIAQAKPKWYMGFSDNTNFTFLSATIADTAAIYDECAAAFGMEPWHPAVQDALDLLCGKITRVHNYDLWEKESVKDEEHPLAPYHDGACGTESISTGSRKCYNGGKTDRWMYGLSGKPSRYAL